MILRRASPPAPRALPFAALPLLGLLMLTACGGKADDSAAAADGGDGAAPCDETGVQGVVTDEAGTLGPSPGARVYAYEGVGVGVAPIETQTDTNGAYSLPLPAGTWSLTAEGSNGCITDGPVTVEVTVCGIEERELVLALCPG
ncbi:MAG: carboxypeptidase regulatory-like domain-containing protein [Deltaproteobacteria bacterium]|nr:carboxypeptidase regulatory-like domain-containing protein [Deltaproteobacteria bacterium]